MVLVNPKKQELKVVKKIYRGIIIKNNKKKQIKNTLDNIEINDEEN